MLMTKLTEHFSYSNSRFISADYNSTTARSVVFHDLEIPQAFTLEASFHGYNQRGGKF